MRRLSVAAALALAMCSSAGIGDAKVNPRFTLAGEARWLVAHGHVHGTGVYEASARLRSISKALVVERFMSAGSEAVDWALCVVDHESGFNPGAMNRTAIAPGGVLGRASGLPQVVVHYHPWVRHWRLMHDPAYAVSVMWRISRGGRDRRAWRGGGYSCP